MKIIPKKFYTKTYSFRVSEEELKMIRRLSSEMNLPAMLREYIRNIHEGINRDPDDTAYKL
jgi:hypothetical protein